MSSESVDVLAPRVLRALADAGILPVATDTAGGREASVADGAAAAAVWAGVLVVAAEQLAGVTGSSQSWSDAARAHVVEDLDRATRVVGAAKAPVLVAQEDSGSWRRPGVRSFEAHRAATGREDIGTTRREKDTARTLTELEGGVAAVANGEMTPSQVHHLGRVADKVDPQVRDQLLKGKGAVAVLDLAREHDPKSFARKVEELAAAQHPATVQDAQEAIRAKRYLRIMSSAAGTRIDGFFDPVAGYRLQLAIEAASPRPSAEDTRTLGQRNADALESIAATALTEGQLAPSPHVPAQVMITMTEATFLAAQDHLAAASHAHETAAGEPRPETETGTDTRAGTEAGSEPEHQPETEPQVGVGDFPLIRAQDGPLLPPADLAKLLCGSAVGRLVVTAQGVPLNAGRSQRTFKNTLRRAVELRDQHCAWPECAQIARYCEVHHLDQWDTDHGETDVHRGVLLCTFHHHELHTHNLDLVIATAPHPPGDVTSRSPGDVTSSSTGEVTPSSPSGASADSPSSPERLPGDPDYEPPRYELVPRAQTSDARRIRLAQRLRQDTARRRAQRAARDARDPRDPRDARDSRDPRDARDSRDPHDPRDGQDPRDASDSRGRGEGGGPGGPLGTAKRPTRRSA